MTPELERAVKRYRQWFGSYKKSGVLIKVQVRLTVNNGCIEFLIRDDSYKVKRIRGTRAQFVISATKKAFTCLVVMDRNAIWRFIVRTGRLILNQRLIA